MFLKQKKKLNNKSIRTNNIKNIQRFKNRVREIFTPSDMKRDH